MKPTSGQSVEIAVYVDVEHLRGSVRPQRARVHRAEFEVSADDAAACFEQGREDGAPDLPALDENCQGTVEDQRGQPVAGRPKRDRRVRREAE
jgi:hypothetical protein